MLIAEIGNNHFGSFEKAKEMIHVAHECGASAVKMQAYRATELSGGSMPKSFYNLCAFSLEQYIELIHFARDEIGIELFYSIFSDAYQVLSYHQSMHKISGGQIKSEDYNMKYYDSPFVFFSIPQGVDLKRLQNVQYAKPMYVSSYLPKDPNLKYISWLAKHFDMNIGYSDHTEGIQWCLKAVKEHNCQVIEKHFTLEKNVAYKGQVFRDTIHGADPYELELLARGLGVAQ